MLLGVVLGTVKMDVSSVYETLVTGTRDHTVTSVQRREYKCGARAPKGGEQRGAYCSKARPRSSLSPIINKKKYIFCLGSWYYVLFLIKYIFIKSVLKIHKHVLRLVISYLKF